MLDRRKPPHPWLFALTAIPYGVGGAFTGQLMPSFAEDAGYNNLGEVTDYIPEIVFTGLIVDRAAAEKRRAQQIRLIDCNHKADAAKVLPRDRAAHVGHCLDAASQ